MLRDEPIEYIKEQYDEKNMVLSSFGVQVSADTMYEDIFGNMDIEIPVVIIDEDEVTKHIKKMPIGDAIAMGRCRNDVLISGCTYIKNWISKKTALDIYTFIIDLDNAYSGTILHALQHDWYTASGDPLAKPTYIVNSGTGLHLYFVLQDRIPNYHSMTEGIDKLYRALAIQQSRRVYVEQQVQWFGQGFRCAGGLNKYGWENTCFRMYDKWDIDELSKAVGVDQHIIHYGEKRTTKPKQDKKHKRTHSTGWKTDRAFYDYALKTCEDKTREGNRYMSMCALSAIAYKCGVSEEELKEGLIGLLPTYNKGATRPIKEKEVYSAMKMYNSKAAVTPRAVLEHWQGWEYKPIKRNHQRQADHLEEARAIRDIRQKRKGTKWTDNNGRKPKKAIVEAWQAEHPQGKKVQCIADTKLSHHTIDKYWVKTE